MRGRELLAGRFVAEYCMVQKDALITTACRPVRSSASVGFLADLHVPLTPQWLTRPTCNSRAIRSDDQV